MTEPNDDGIDALLAAARQDRPVGADDERLERRVLGAIAAGTVATVAMPSGAAAAAMRFLAASKPFAAFAILALGAGGAVWIATGDTRSFLAAPDVRPHTHAVPAVAPAPEHEVSQPPATPPAPLPIVSPAPIATRAPTPHHNSPAAAPATRRTLPAAPAPQIAATPIDPAAVATPVREEGATPPAPAIAPSEVSLLAQARAALRRGDSRGALAAIAEHDTQYPAGQFSEELDVLRVEALAAAGRSAEAQTRAAAFARHWPGSTYAVRVRRAVETGAP